jgi:hypothetical protein
VTVPFARTISTSRTWSKAAPHCREIGPNPPIVACPPIPTCGHVPWAIARPPASCRRDVTSAKSVPEPMVACQVELSMENCWKLTMSTTTAPSSPPMPRRRSEAYTNDWEETDRNSHNCGLHSAPALSPHSQQHTARSSQRLPRWWGESQQPE